MAALLCLGAAGIPIAAFAGRPLVVDDAGTVPRGKAELEVGVGFVKDGGSKHYDVPLGLAIGVTHSVEIGIGFDGQLEEREEPFGGSNHDSGIGDFTAGLKWNLLHDDTVIAGHAIAVTAKFPTADSGRGLGSGDTDVDAAYILSLRCTERLTMHWNAGYTVIGCEHARRSEDIVHTGVAAGYALTPAVELVAELFSDIPRGMADDWALSANAGVRWTVGAGLTLDAAAGIGLRGAAPTVFATAGFTWAFGLIPKARSNS